VPLRAQAANVKSTFNMNEYLIECQSCEQESHIVSDIEPNFCPMCGQPAAAIIINEEEEEDDI